MNKTEENLKSLLKKYIPLNDTYRVELRPPVYEPKAIYYGEWYYIK